MLRIPVRIACFAMLALGSAAIAAETAAEADMKKMAGTWTVKRLQIAGLEAGADIRGKVRVTIEGNRMTVKGFDVNDVKNTFTLNPSAKPAEIDLEPMRKQAPPGKGIYQLDGAALTICVADDGERPKEFASKPKSGQVLMVLEKSRD